jgi:acetyltransferase-like isoleucine patch superfamily enzyme
MRVDKYHSFSASASTELQEYKLQTLKKLNEFNDLSIPDGSTLASLKSRRMAVAKSMLGQLGENVNIEPSFFVGWGCNIFIGDNVYINRE